VKKFNLSGQVSDLKNKTHARCSRTAEVIVAVTKTVEENPGLSIPRHSLELGIRQTSLHRILHKDLSLKAYTVQ